MNIFTQERRSHSFMLNSHLNIGAFFAAFGGREMRGGEGTSRSVKGLQAPCLPVPQTGFPASSRPCNLDPLPAASKSHRVQVGDEI